MRRAVFRISRRSSGLSRLSVASGKPLVEHNLTTNGLLLRACEDQDSKVQGNKHSFLGHRFKLTFKRHGEKPVTNRI